jgi:hypothetical protein
MGMGWLVAVTTVVVAVVQQSAYEGYSYRVKVNE